MEKFQIKTVPMPTIIRAAYPDRLKSLRMIYPTYIFPECQLQGLSPNHKLRIICPEHGEFEASIKGLLYNKRGCPRCLEEEGKAYRRSIESIIEQLKPIYEGHDIDWSKTRRVPGNRKIELYCNKHGRFSKSLQQMRKGGGCPVCNHRSRYDIKIKYRGDKFEEKARAIHGDKYDYSKSIYTGSIKPIIITCPTHGDFTAVASHHLNRKAGCPFCSGYASCSNEYADKIKEISEDKITVGPLQDMRHKIDAKCNECGYTWRPWPRALLDGHGCPICSRKAMTGFNVDKPAELYLIKFIVDNKEIFKIGITGKGVRNRVICLCNISTTDYEIISTVKFESGRDALIWEMSMLEELEGYRYMGDKFLRTGMTETLVIDPRLILKEHPFDPIP